MSYRFMRVIVFFDLPVDTAAHRREYSKFRKYLIKNGYVMMQQSVYTKLAVNQNAAAAYINAVNKFRPPEGVVQVLTITEKQFQKMEFICGGFNTDIVISDERILLL